jgi:hypothetical protein
MMAFNKIPNAFVRLCSLHNLIFFACILASSCNNQSGQQAKDITIRWENKRATGVFIPSSFTANIPTDSIQQLVVVSLAKKDHVTPIFGNYTVSDGVLFQPLVAFSPGNEYSILVRNKRVGSFSVPASSGTPPSVVTIFPHGDTLPENILKLYVQFSQPMREGQSGKYIHLVNNHGDTLPDVFLDLQPELWNEDRTVLTMWFDPGRIKRDLQPNMRLGPPLKAGDRYQLVVDKNWPDVQELSLVSAYTMPFTAGNRDSLSPEPANWNIHPPLKGTRDSLQIDIPETLDYFLLKECLQLEDADGKKVEGQFTVSNKSNHAQFGPREPWTAGVYSLIVQTKLEDLAGNNINRPFDRDISRQTHVSEDRFVKRNFIVK